MQKIDREELDKMLRRNNQFARNKRGGKQADLREVDFSWQRLNGVNFNRALLDGASFAHASLSGATFVDASMTGADLSDASLYEADLTHANLSGANLSCATLRHAILDKAFLHYANLRQADLWMASLQNANFYMSDLTLADLDQANLNSASLYQSTLTGIHLSGATLVDIDGPVCFGHFGRHTIVAAGGIITAGCQRFTYQEWLEKGHMIAFNHGYDRDERAAYGLWVIAAIRTLEPSLIENREDMIAQLIAATFTPELERVEE